ncbi:MAG: hypothetical protein K8R68_05095, partial [Bacteroidales bacterium]|nr:hypothetical protein [Bacteroidales bacterium]
MKKATVMGVILLFIGVSFIPSISGSIGELSTASRIEEVSDISFKLKKTHENDIASYDESAVFDADNSFSNTIYVDDDNTDGPWDGTQEHPYQHIQDAVDNASKGDTVFVYSGIYYEHIVINTSISLVGEYRETPIIDGN